jgi:hypothetical protein
VPSTPTASVGAIFPIEEKRMKSRFEQLQDPQQRRQFALFRSSSAVAVVAALMVGAIYLPQGEAPGAQVGVEFDLAPPLSEAPVASRPSHVLESAGTDDQDPHQYAGQPAVF